MRSKNLWCLWQDDVLSINTAKGKELSPAGGALFFTQQRRCDSCVDLYGYWFWLENVCSRKWTKSHIRWDGTTYIFLNNDVLVRRRFEQIEQKLTKPDIHHRSTAPCFRSTIREYILSKIINDGWHTVSINDPIITSFKLWIVYLKWRFLVFDSFKRSYTYHYCRRMVAMQFL